MKKILFLLLVTISSYAQTYQNPTFGTVTTKTNTESATATKINVQETDGKINWLQPVNIPIPYIPTGYTPTSATLGGHLLGINNELESIVATTAGITTRVWFTADQTTITAGTFDLTNQANKGTAPSHIQSVTNDDNQKKYYTTDLISIAFPNSSLSPPGIYAGNLSASTTPNSAQQRWTVEIYKCNNAGTPIASGITGAPVGDLGVTVIAILDSGLLTLADGSVTNVQVSGNLASPLSMAVGERIRYHVSAEKVGTAASNITQSVYYGDSYNSYYDVPVPLNTTAVLNLSGVTGANTTEALNTLNASKTTTLNTISELLAYTGTSKFINVLESERGGNFYFVASGLTSDNGVIFNHATSGYWVRQLNGFVVPEFWGTGTTTSFSFIQSALDYAAGKNIKVMLAPKQYNIDDCLIIKSNTEMVLDKKTIIRLNDNVNKSMLRNFGAVYAGSTALIDSNITVSGGVWEGNGANQTLYSAGGSPSLNVGIEFHNIENLRIHDTKINIVRSYAVYISSAKNVFIDKTNVDNGDVKNLNRDGLHFAGPTDNVIINDCVLRGTDDQLAFNADDISYAYKVDTGGAITNTVVNNIVFDNTYKGVRLLAGDNNISRMIFTNITGVTTGNLIECGAYGLSMLGKIDDVQFNNIDVNVNQTVNDGRTVFHFTKGVYGKIMLNNIKISGNHYTNSTIEFVNGVVMDYFKINNFVSIGTDTGAYSDFKIRQGEATFPNIGTFIIDGYNYISPLKSSNLIDIVNLTNNYFEVSNSNISSIATIANIASSTLNKVVLNNNYNAISTNGIVLASVSANDVQIGGSYFKDALGFAFSQDTPSNIVSLKGTAFVNNDNADVSTNLFIPYKNNGVSKQLKTVSTATLNEVLTNGNTSTLGMSVKQVELGTGSSNTVPTISWNYSGNFGWGIFESNTTGNLLIKSKNSGVVVDALEIARSTGNTTFYGNITAPNATLTGTPTAPTASVGTNTTQLATTAFVQATRPYKVWVGFITQSLTASPVSSIVFENTLGGTITWSRTGAGDYLGTLSAGTFGLAKTWIQILQNSGTSTPGVFSSQPAGSTTLQIVSNNLSGVKTDSLLNAWVEIRVYP